MKLARWVQPERMQLLMAGSAAIACDLARLAMGGWGAVCLDAASWHAARFAPCVGTACVCADTAAREGGWWMSGSVL